MDPLGHASIALMAKPLAPKAPLWALIAATQVPDILFFGFQALGIEYQAKTTFSIADGLQYLSPPSIPWSHGLVMCTVWSALVAFLVLVISRDLRSSIVIGLMVLGHWALDAVVYPIMPVLFDNSHMIGIGLMTSGAGFMASILIEVSLIVSGVVIYWKTRKRTS